MSIPKAKNYQAIIRLVKNEFCGYNPFAKDEQMFGSFFDKKQFYFPGSEF